MTQTLQKESKENQIQHFEIFSQEKEKEIKEHYYNSPFEIFLSNRIKVGKSQYKSSLAINTISLADGSEIYVIGMIMPIIQDVWQLSVETINLLGTLVFLGVAIGALVAGYLADKFGRRMPLVLSSIFLFISSFCSYIVPNFDSLLITRLLFGVGMGLGVPTIATYQAEIYPYHCRGKFFSLFAFAFPLGEISVVIFAWCTFNSLKDGPWRLLLLWAALPTIPCIIFIYFYVQESAKFYLLCSDHKVKAFEIMDKMGQANDKNYQRIEEQEKRNIEAWADNYKLQNQNENKSYSELFYCKNLKKTVLLSIVWFSLSFVYYGVAFNLPQILIRMRQESGQNLEHNKASDFLGIMFSVLVEFPSNFLAAYIVESRLGRVKSLGISFLLTAICSLICFFETLPNFLFFTMISLIKFFIRICFLVSYTLTGEQYETRIKGRGLSFTNAVCRVGGMVMPIIGVFFFRIGTTGPLLSFAIVSFLSAMATFMLTEYKDIDAQQISSSSNSNLPSLQDMSSTK